MRYKMVWMSWALMLIFGQFCLGADEKVIAKGREILLTGSEYKPLNQSFFEQKRREFILQEFVINSGGRQKFQLQPGGMDAGMPGDTDYFLIERRYSYSNPPGWLKIYLRIPKDEPNVCIMAELNYLCGRCWQKITMPLELRWDGVPFGQFGQEALKLDWNKVNVDLKYYKASVLSHKKDATNGLHILSINDVFVQNPKPIGIDYELHNMAAPFGIIDCIRITSDREIEVVDIREKYDEALKNPPSPISIPKPCKKIKIYHAWWRPDLETDTSYTDLKGVTSGHPLDKIWCMPREQKKHPLLGASHLLILNNGNQKVKITGLAIDRVPVEQWMERGKVIWYRIVPRNLNPKEIGEVIIRFRKPIKSHRTSLLLENGCSITGKIKIEPWNFRMSYLGCNKNMNEVYLYIENEGKEEFIDKVEINGEDVTQLSHVLTFKDLSGLQHIYIKVPLEKPLKQGEWLTGLVKSKRGKVCAGRVRAWKSVFLLGAWAAINDLVKTYPKRYHIHPLPFNSIWSTSGDGWIYPNTIEFMNEHPYYYYIVTSVGAFGHSIHRRLQLMKKNKKSNPEEIKKYEEALKNIIPRLKQGKLPFALVHPDEIDAKDCVSGGEIGYYAQLAVLNQEHWAEIFPYALSGSVLDFTYPPQNIRVYGELLDLPNQDYYVQTQPLENVFGIKSLCETIRAACMPGPGLIMLGTERYKAGSPLKPTKKPQPKMALDNVRFRILLSAACGVRGVTFFAFSPNPYYGTPPFWDAVARAIGILDMINPQLNKSQVVDLVRSPDKNVYVRSLLLGEDGLAVFIFNMNYQNPDPKNFTNTEEDQPKWIYRKDKVRVVVSLPSWMNIDEVILLDVDRPQKLQFHVKSNKLFFELPQLKVAELVYLKAK